MATPASSSPSGVGASAGLAYGPPAPSSSSSSGPAGIGGGASGEAKPPAGQFVPTALTGWNVFSRALGVTMPGDLAGAAGARRVARARLAAMARRR